MREIQKSLPKKVGQKTNSELIISSGLSKGFVALEERIPQELKALNHWVLYKVRPLPGKEKFTKYPYNVRTKTKTDVTASKNWSNFEDALNVVQRDSSSFNGLGFCLSKEAGIICIDLDHCINEGKISTFASSILEKIPLTYIEISYSGKGLHVFLKGRVPGNRNKAILADGNTVEIYGSKRFIAMTGNSLYELSQPIVDGQEALTALYSEWFPDSEEIFFQFTEIDTIGNNLSDNELLDRMLNNTKNGTKVRALWDGSINGFEEDDSRADASLLCYLAFWTNRDVKRMERLFNQSRLGKRDKWIKRADYRRRSIQNAISKTQEGYQTEPLLSVWQEPKELPFSLPSVKLFDCEILPEALRDWAIDIAERLQCPIDFVAVGAVITLATLVGRKISIRPKSQDDWQEVPNLWGMIIGNPGILKTPALTEALSILYQLQKEALDQHKHDTLLHNANEKLEEFRDTKLNKKLKNAFNENEEEALQIAFEVLREKEEGKAPVLQRYIVNDATVEKIGELLKDNKNGFLIYRDELIGFLKGLEKQGQETARSFYLESWNGKASFTYDRIQRGTIHIPFACVSIVGSTQPGPIGTYIRESIKMGSGNDGFIQRFQLSVYPDITKEWRNVDRAPNQTAKSKALNAYRALAAMEIQGYEDSHNNETEIPYLNFTLVAQERFDEWRYKLEHRLRANEEHPVIEAHLAKYRSLIPSLALLFHLIDFGATSVGLPALEKALWWGDYLESHARRIYSIGIGADVDAAQRLIKHIKKKDLPNPFTLREVYRKGWACLGIGEAQLVLELLEDYQYVQKAVVQTGGRSREDYYVNPALLKNTK